MQRVGSLGLWAAIELKGRPIVRVGVSGPVTDRKGGSSQRFGCRGSAYQFAIERIHEIRGDAGIDIPARRHDPSSPGFEERSYQTVQVEYAGKLSDAGRTSGQNYQLNKGQVQVRDLSRIQ